MIGDRISSAGLVEISDAFVQSPPLIRWLMWFSCFGRSFGANAAGRDIAYPDQRSDFGLCLSFTQTSHHFWMSPMNKVMRPRTFCSGLTGKNGSRSRTTWSDLRCFRWNSESKPAVHIITRTYEEKRLPCSDIPETWARLAAKSFSAVSHSDPRRCFGFQINGGSQGSARTGSGSKCPRYLSMSGFVQCETDTAPLSPS
jgi:hypothetical protein